VLLLLSGATAACGGGPDSGALKDGAGMGAPTPADAGANADGSPAPGPVVAPPGGCWRNEQGCNCSDWGQTVACKGPVFRDGNYVTCAGTRECVNGVWGPCWPPNYQSAGTSAHAH
jgi:hypothetical protein